MAKTKARNILLILFFKLLFISNFIFISSAKSSCSQETKQSPINIIPPFTFTDFKGEFQFSNVQEGFLLNNNSTLKIEGDFGTIIYGNKVFNTYEINFKSPSEHTIGEGNVSFPLELQISSTSEDNLKVNVAILFSLDSQDSVFLYKLGFGRGLMQHLQENQNLEFKESFSLKEIVPKENKFFIYSGSTTNEICSDAVWIISYNTFRISQRQIDDFPKNLVYKRKPLQDLQLREIFITFYPFNSETKKNITNKQNNTSLNDNKNLINEKISFDDMENENSKNSKNDPFTFLGDTTEYILDFPFNKQNKSTKLIKNNDYMIVYNKEFAKTDDPTKISIDDSVVDEILQKLEEKEKKENPNLFKNESQNENRTENLSNSNEIDQITTILLEQPSLFKKISNKKIFNSKKKFSSFLQTNEQPYFVITEEMIKNSGDKPIILPSNILQNLLVQQNQSNKINDQTIPVSFVETKLKKKNEERTNDFIPYIPDNEPLDSTPLKVEKPSLLSKSEDNHNSEELKNMKDEMKKMMDYIDNKLESARDQVLSTKDTSFSASLNKAIIDKNIDKAQEHLESVSNSILDKKSNNKNDIDKLLDEPIEEEKKAIKIDIISKTKVYPGQGRLAVDSIGKWDGIIPYNVTYWPETCRSGKIQSPIHIGLNEIFYPQAHKIEVNYGKAQNKEIIIQNDGVKLAIKGDFGTLLYGDHEFRTKEIHIHHPSEHTFGEDEARTDYEFQILHEDKAGVKFILAVFLHNMDEEINNEFLDDLKFSKEYSTVWLDSFSGRKITNENLDLNKLVGSVNHYISYDGSITTPPCTEGVKWAILRKRKNVTKHQVEAFEILFGRKNNVRGTQSLGDRKIKLF